MKNVTMLHSRVSANQKQKWKFSIQWEYSTKIKHSSIASFDRNNSQRGLFKNTQEGHCHDKTFSPSLIKASMLCLTSRYLFALLSVKLTEQVSFRDPHKMLLLMVSIREETRVKAVKLVFYFHLVLLVKSKLALFKGCLISKRVLKFQKNL